jgi:hypothetical protein
MVHDAAFPEPDRWRLPPNTLSPGAPDRALITDAPYGVMSTLFQRGSSRQ